MFADTGSRKLSSATNKVSPRGTFGGAFGGEKDCAAPARSFLVASYGYTGVWIFEKLSHLSSGGQA